VITGDDFENVSKKKQVLLPCSWWSPMIAMLLKIRCCKRNENVEIRKVNKHRAYSFE
jgi:hypothetical protein